MVSSERRGMLLLVLVAVVVFVLSVDVNDGAHAETLDGIWSITARRARRKRQGVFIMVTTVGCWKLKGDDVALIGCQQIDGLVVYL
jgi:hypothetical protein